MPNGGKRWEFGLCPLSVLFGERAKQLILLQKKGGRAV